MENIEEETTVNSINSGNDNVIANLTPKELNHLTGSDAPYIPLSDLVVEPALEFARISSSDTLVDLGTGDCRFLFAALDGPAKRDESATTQEDKRASRVSVRSYVDSDFDYLRGGDSGMLTLPFVFEPPRKCIGVETNDLLVRYVRAKALKYSSMVVRVMREDMLRVDFDDMCATVIIATLQPDMLEKLKPQLCKWFSDCSRASSRMRPFKTIIQPSFDKVSSGSSLQKNENTSSDTSKSSMANEIHNAQSDSADASFTAEVKPSRNRKLSLGVDDESKQQQEEKSKSVNIATLSLGKLTKLWKSEENRKRPSTPSPPASNHSPSSSPLPVAKDQNIIDENSMKPGRRIVTVMFSIPGWEPVKAVEVKEISKKSQSAEIPGIWLFYYDESSCFL